MTLLKIALVAMFIVAGVAIVVMFSDDQPQLMPYSPNADEAN